MSEEVNPFEQREVVNTTCRAKDDHGNASTCSGTQADKVTFSPPNQPGRVYFECKTCGQTWLPLNVGGHFPY